MIFVASIFSSAPIFKLGLILYESEVLVVLKQAFEIGVKVGLPNQIFFLFKMFTSLKFGF